MDSSPGKRADPYSNTVVSKQRVMPDGSRGQTNERIQLPLHQGGRKSATLKKRWFRSQRGYNGPLSPIGVGVPCKRNLKIYFLLLYLFSEYKDITVSD